MIALDRLPPEIRASRRCVVWRAEVRAGRATKVPYLAACPSRRAAVDDPATWAPFAVALAAVEAGFADGVGIVLGAGLVGIDLDHVRDPATGALDAEAARIVGDLDSYAEVSPSGTGVHVLCRGALPPGGRRRGSIEMYDRARYFTLTGEHVAGTPRTLAERTAALAALHRRLFPPPPPPPRRPGGGIPRDDAAVLARAHAARNAAKFAALWRGDWSGYASQSEADLALASLLAYWVDGDAAAVDRLFRQSGLARPKWDERRGELTYGARTIARACGRPAA
jgi:primase-polymerase (primpol)-like protein